MRHLRVSGPAADAKHHARRLYRKHCARDRHTVLIGIADIDNSFPQRRMSQCDVLITAHAQGGPLTIEESAS